MTTPTPAAGERVNLPAFERDLAAVFTAHGLTGQVTAREIEQAGHVAGVTVSAFAYTPPPGVPAPRPETAPAPFAEDLEVAS